MIAWIACFLLADMAWGQQMGVQVTGMVTYSTQRVAPAISPTRQNHFSLNGPGASFVLGNTDGNFHVFRLESVMFNSVYTTPGDSMIASGRSSGGGISASYGYQFFLLKQKDCKLKPFVALNGGLGAGFYRLSPVTSNQFPERSQNITLTAGVEPGVRLNTEKHLFFDFSLPVYFAEAYFRHYRIENPVVPVNAQTVNEVGFEMFSGPVFAFRFGLGFWIGNKAG